MRTNVVNKLVFVVILGMFFGIQSINSQVIDSKNKVEYISDDLDVDDLNSLSSSSIATKKVTGVPVKRVKKKTSARKNNISVEDLQKITNLRFRKKRGMASEKCKKEAEKECDSIEKKKKQLEKKKK